MILKAKTVIAALPLALAALSLAVTGCRTFNYTEEDLERERAGVEKNSQYSIFGGVTGGSYPGFGNVNCGNMHVGSVGGFCGK